MHLIIYEVFYLDMVINKPTSLLGLSHNLKIDLIKVWYKKSPRLIRIIISYVIFYCRCYDSKIEIGFCFYFDAVCFIFNCLV